MHTIRSIKAVTCLALDADGISLVSGSDDGMLRVWDTKTRNIIRVFKHPKGPVNNVLIVRLPLYLNGQMPSLRRHGSLLTPALEKYASSTEENAEVKALIAHQTTCNRPPDGLYHSSEVMNDQGKELQQQGSSVASDMELERLKLDCTRSMQMVQQWKKMYETLHQYCVNELLDEDLTGNSS